jgi:hypothetical protein
MAILRKPQSNLVLVGARFSKDLLVMRSAELLIFGAGVPAAFYACHAAQAPYGEA